MTTQALGRNVGHFTDVWVNDVQETLSFKISAKAVRVFIAFNSKHNLMLTFYTHYESDHDPNIRG